MHRTARTAAGLVAATVLVVACGGTDAEAPSAVPAAPDAAPATPDVAPPAPPVTTTPPTGPAPSVTPPGSTLATQVSGVPETPAALRFTAPLVGGGEIDLAGYAGQPVLFWFWAPY